MANDIKETRLIGTRMKDTGVRTHFQRQQVPSEQRELELTELFWKVAARLLASTLTTD